MKLIKLSSAALLAMLAMGTATTVAHAAGVEGGSYKTTGEVAYTSPVDPDPVDPIDPDDPDDPNPPIPDPAPTPTPGPLSIDYAPTLNFDTHEISSTDETYYAKPTSTDKGDRPNWVQVSDVRGTLGGWSLNVTQEAQFANPDVTAGSTGSALNGAQLTFANAHVVTSSETPADVFADTTTLVPGTASGTILGATAGNGSGTSQLVFGSTAEATSDKSVSLMVPGKATKLVGTYSTDLTWTLSNVPAS